LALILGPHAVAPATALPSDRKKARNLVVMVWPPTLTTVSGVIETPFPSNIVHTASKSRTPSPSSSHPMMMFPLLAMAAPKLSVLELLIVSGVLIYKVLVLGVKPLSSGIPGNSGACAWHRNGLVNRQSPSAM